MCGRRAFRVACSLRKAAVSLVPGSWATTTVCGRATMAAAGYLRRIRALFPDKRRVLHLFSGRVDLKALAGDTVDINAELDMAWCLLILRIASRTLSDTRRA